MMRTSDGAGSRSGRPTTRRGLLLGGGLAAVGILAACSEPEPGPTLPKAPASSAPAPAADRDQLERAVSEIHDALVAADKARDPKKLPPRIIGSAAKARTAAYSIIKTVPDYASKLSTPSADLRVAVTSTGTEFPRTAIALVGAQDGGGERYFVALTQKDARAPYATWGWAAQSAGVSQLPTVNSDARGGAPVPFDADDLVMSPKDALAQYAAMLSSGKAANKGGLIADDPFATQVHEGIQAERADLNKGVQPDSLAKVHEAYRSTGAGEYVGIRTADGGAIVMGSMTSTRTIRTVGGAVLNIQDKDKDGKPFAEVKIAGKTRFAKEFVREFNEAVVLSIPAKSKGGKVQPFGATKSLLSARGA